MAKDHSVETALKCWVKLGILRKSPGDCAETQHVVYERDNRRSQDRRAANVNNENAVVCRPNSGCPTFLSCGNGYCKDPKPHDGEGAYYIFVVQVHCTHSKEEKEGCRGYGDSIEPHRSGKYFTAVSDRSS